MGYFRQPANEEEERRSLDRLREACQALADATGEEVVLVVAPPCRVSLGRRERVPYGVYRSGATRCDLSGPHEVIAPSTGRK